ncbi:hypothetical protein CFRA_06060 [Corynebacterium frankenforstense DSM 45800]|uniref:VWFA domain-containing protein n=1 Tax=Corynebacterium frankenforstense DSM 45800 TaxID=1437875 RepID=A0A1L7CSU6_9CORY|nr:hypothetical protein [Corynebacterium frankenforstense]APT88881.1 hypothetical protein CFRA_06060 [Corynebacterium frankenforstense DSM 45800]
MAGRHRTDTDSPKVAGWLIVAVILVIALITALIAWFALRDSERSARSEAEGDCIEGELTLPVAEAFPGAADELIAAYRDSAPVVRDHCIVPETAPVADAAVFVGVDSPAADAALKAADRSRGTASPQPAGTKAVGLAAREAAGPESTAADQVVYPAGDQTDIAVTAAAKLAGDDAAELLKRDRGEKLADADGSRPVAATEATAPEDTEFTPIEGAELSLSAIPLDAAGADADEEVTRAAADFTEFAGGRNSAEADRPDDALYAAAGTAATGDGDRDDAAAAPADGAAHDTLFLVDTSAAMEPQADGLAAAVGGPAAKLAEDGHAVALWNYSSPLNPGVTVPYRTNLGFGDGAQVEGVVDALGTGGVPMTRTSVLAALGSVQSQAAQTGEPVRLVVVTTGTAPGDMDDGAFGSALKDALGEDVELAVVHVGDGETDRVLSENAKATAKADGGRALDEAVARLAGVES